jgi:esterase/lipase superfamily enzyme
MHREYHKWWSPSLHRDMEMIVVGHHGARVLVFPTSKGSFHEWEDRGMFGSNGLGHHIDNGWLQFFCVDSVDAESWYNWSANVAHRAARQNSYMRYLTDEVIPLTRVKNDNPFLISAGASFGAYHAACFAFRYPELVGRVLALSGMFDIKSFTGGLSNDTVYFNNPMDFLQHEHDGPRLDMLRRLDIIIATGRDDRLRNESEALSRVLWNRGIGNALRLWDGWSHDWPYWQKMMQTYVGGHD